MAVIAMPSEAADLAGLDVHSTPSATPTTPPKNPRGTPTRNAIESTSPTFCPSIAGSSAPTTPRNPARSAVGHHQREAARCGDEGAGGVGAAGGGHACCSGAGTDGPPALTGSGDGIADPLSLDPLCATDPAVARAQGQASRASSATGTAPYPPMLPGQATSPTHVGPYRRPHDPGRHRRMKDSAGGRDYVRVNASGTASQCAGYRSGGWSLVLGERVGAGQASGPGVVRAASTKAVRSSWRSVVFRAPRKNTHVQPSSPHTALEMISSRSMSSPPQKVSNVTQ